jgi:hypothetical protein
MCQDAYSDSPCIDERRDGRTSSLRDRSRSMSTTMSAILDRAGGNPLYAEEFVRLLKDKSLLVRKAVYRSG